MKLWGGRFQKGTEKAVEQFTASVQFDKRLYQYDILGSIAHCRMLAKQGVIGDDDSRAIVRGLVEIAEEISSDQFHWRIELEDVHMNIEARLKEKIGDVAGKLHTARSRNDQIALDTRLFTREAIAETIERIVALQRTLIDIAESNVDVILPGYTHLQRAQPVLLSHHLLAYFEMLQRDIDRFIGAYERCNVMPLGSGALAGTTFPIDRDFVARELGFKKVTRNSMDAVSDRDFVVDYISAASITMMHLSRFAEEIVLWSSTEFGFIELDDAYSTGSSMMPQKKNPDIAELVRGKTGRIFGHLQAILTTLKGLPLTYNRDLQEDKEGLFDTVDTLLSCLSIFDGMLKTTKFRKTVMRDTSSASFSLATDIADYLVRRGLPFRQAHEVVGKIVAYCLDTRKDFSQLTLDEFRAFSSLFDPEVLQITVDSSVAARDIPGGTAPRRVAEALRSSAELLQQNRVWLDQRPRTAEPKHPD